jgi:hypothetical protein
MTDAFLVSVLEGGEWSGSRSGHKNPCENSLRQEDELAPKLLP